MFGLRPGDKSLLGAVPVVDVRAMDRFQLVGIDIFVSVAYGFAFPVWPYLSALVQQYVEVMGVEYKLPETGPMVAGPYVKLW